MAFEVFISHASEDKDAFVRPLATWLSLRGLKVWYDEYVMKVGDSIRGKINEGLRNCQFGIVVLSEHFYAKPWPQKELDALYNLMINDPEKRILPVLFQFSPEELAKKDPLLSDIFAVNAEHGVDVVGRHLMQAMVDAEANKRGQELTQYKHRHYDHNYYRPPEDIPRFGYRFDAAYEFEKLEAALRPREVLICFLHNPRGGGWNSACHLTCKERLRDFQRDYGPELEVYAVDIDKLKGKFDNPFTNEELARIRYGV